MSTLICCLRTAGWQSTRRRENSRKPLSARFWSKVNKRGRIVRARLGHCWEWQAYVDPMGYGRFQLNDVARLAHHVSWVLSGKGEVSDCLLHKCDNRICVRPDHLFKGSRTDNARDRDQKGRCAKGESHYACKLSDAQVQEIRLRAAAGARTTDLAKEYNVGANAISRIRLGKARRA